MNKYHGDVLIRLVMQKLQLCGNKLIWFLNSIKVVPQAYLPCLRPFSCLGYLSVPRGRLNTNNHCQGTVPRSQSCQPERFFPTNLPFALLYVSTPIVQSMHNRLFQTIILSVRHIVNCLPTKKLVKGESESEIINFLQVPHTSENVWKIFRNIYLSNFGHWKSSSKRLFSSLPNISSQ